MKPIYAFLAFFPFSALALITPKAATLIPSRVIYAVPPQTALETSISGSNWHYTVPFEVKNTADIAKLIQCESQGVNISRPDSDGIISSGILQFHGTSTWSDMSRLSGITGSPIMPEDAIRMADWMISHGFLGRWTCAHILHLLND